MITRLDLAALQPFHDAGILDIPDVQTAMAMLRIGGQSADDPVVGLAAGLCVRALRSGSVCIDLRTDPGDWAAEVDEPVELTWPEPHAWREALADSPLVAVGTDTPRDRPMRLVGSLLYLQRYWCDEQWIRETMRARSTPKEVDAHLLTVGLRRLFPEPGPDRQRLAAATAALRQATIIAGGPGTGKTTTVARMLAVLKEADPTVRGIALAAPTGKAAVRLEQAVNAALSDLSAQDRDRLGTLTASTLHRLLGWRPDSTGRFRHDRSNPLPHDVVVVDETSMVSLPLMARLLEAVRPDARLVLVGDPDQLASIEAGAVLADLVAAAPADHGDPRLLAGLAVACPHEADAVGRAGATGVVALDRNYRFGGAIAALASAIRDGDAEGAVEVLRAGHADVEFLDPHLAGTAEIVHQDVVAVASAVHARALDGDARAALAALDSHRVLCAHRVGPAGVAHWDDLIAGWTRPLVGTLSGTWYAGQPLLVTANDYTADLYNGDTGVIVRSPDGELRAAFARGDEVLELPLSRLDAVQTLRAMTIHRGQGSQFAAATVILPPDDSPLLTRELLYTAVTRARHRVRIVGSETAVRAGVEREVRRASGLRDSPA